MNSQLTDFLKQNGYSATTSRSDIFDILQLRGAVPIVDLVRGCRRSNRASVYRTISLFRKLGMIQDVVITGEPRIELTDRFGHHHHHLTCVRCGETVSVDDAELETALARVVAKHQFRHGSHTVEISGLCPYCAESL